MRRDVFRGRPVECDGCGAAIQPGQGCVSDTTTHYCGTVCVEEAIRYYENKAKALRAGLYAEARRR